MSLAGARLPKFLALGLALALAAVAQGRADDLRLLERDPDTGTRPAWTDGQLPSQPGWMFFMGDSEAASRSEASEKAFQAAQNDAAQQAGSQVSDVLSDGASYSNGQGQEQVQDQSRSMALVAITEFTKEANCTEEWGTSKGHPTSFHVWVLVKTPKAAFDQAVKQARENLQQMAAGRDQSIKVADATLAQAQSLLRKGDGQAASGFEDQADIDWRTAKSDLEGMVLPTFQSFVPDQVPQVGDLLAQLKDRLQGDAGRMGNFKVTIARLVRAMRRSGAPVAVVRATYEDTEADSSMGPKLIDMVEDEMAEQAQGSVMLNRVFVRRLAEHQVSVEDLEDGLDPAAAAALKLHSAVFIQYWPETDGVELKMTLLKPGLGEVMASARCVVPMDKLPGGAAGVKPSHLDVAENALKAFGLDSAGSESQDDGIPVKVWPLRGESCTYTEGEDVGFCVRLRRPGYVYLVHADASGKVQLLIPNAWQGVLRAGADQTITFPDKDADFEFSASPPDGADVVVAIATARPLSSVSAPQDGFEDLGSADGGQVQALMSEFGSLPQEERGIGRVVYSTVAAP